MVHVVYACPYHTHRMLADICDTVAMTVQMYPHAHHAIMGDWQCNIVIEEFGLLLKGMGWIAHSDFLGQRPRNRPFRGESRRLDEMFLCPSLAGNIQEAHQEAIAGASTHDLMNVVLGFDLDPIRGVQIQRGLNRDEVSVLIQNSSEEVWDQPWETSWSPAELYREWVRRLHLWRRLNEGAFSGDSRKVCVDACDGKAPIKPRCLYRQNTAKKAASWFGELRGLLNRPQWQRQHVLRVRALLVALRKLAWSTWAGGDEFGGSMPESMGDLWWDAVSVIQWADQFWEDIYLRILRESRHGLNSWKLKMLDAVGGGNLRPLSQWLKGRSELPVLRDDDGRFITHPKRVGEELARFWGGFLAIPPPDIQEHHIREMTRDMPKETLGSPLKLLISGSIADRPKSRLWEMTEYPCRC